MARVLVIGCGYAGARIAAAHRDRGDRVAVTVRTRSRVPDGVDALPFDLDADTLRTLPASDRVYYTVPPPDSGVVDVRLARLLDTLPPPCAVVYLGTTGVYGNRRGALTPESAPLAPGSDRARRRVDAEHRLRVWSARSGVPVALLRVSAIYGPGRLPLDRLRQGAPVAHPADTGPGNRIHVDDLVRAAIATGDAVAETRKTEIWNVSDGNPMSVADFHDCVADAAGLPRPRRVPLDSAEISAGWRRFFTESRRIDNRRLLAVPGFRLRYMNPALGVLHSIDGNTVTM